MHSRTSGSSSSSRMGCVPLQIRYAERRVSCEYASFWRARSLSYSAKKIYSETTENCNNCSARSRCPGKQTQTQAANPLPTRDPSPSPSPSLSPARPLQRVHYERRPVTHELTVTRAPKCLVDHPISCLHRAPHLVQQPPLLKIRRHPPYLIKSRYLHPPPYLHHCLPRPRLCHVRLCLLTICLGHSADRDHLAMLYMCRLVLSHLHHLPSPNLCRLLNRTLRRLLNRNARRLLNPRCLLNPRRLLKPSRPLVPNPRHLRKTHSRRLIKT